MLQLCEMDVHVLVFHMEWVLTPPTVGHAEQAEDTDKNMFENSEGVLTKFK